jgi:hypothetical protein
MHHKIASLTAAALLVLAGTANAQQAKESIFSVSGFGTLGAAHSDNDQADFVSTVFHPNGAGHTHSTSVDVDTKVGLQVTASVTDKLSAVVQLISQQRYDKSYAPTLEWGNVSYQITPDFSARIGRTVWPLFLRSDTVNVGYANYSIRNSAELAAEMPNTYSDGADASYRFHFGNATNTVQALFGKSKVNYPGDGNALDVTDIMGVSNVFEYDALTVHLAYMSMRYLFIFPGGSPEKVKLPMATLGFMYDPGGWFITGDFLHAPDPYYGTMRAFSLGGGYRIGKFTPYASYSQFKQATVGSIGGEAPKDTQGTSTLGVRWDFMKNMDFKLQYDHIKSGDVATIFPISLANIQPGFLNRPSANVISAVVDFVF